MADIVAVTLLRHGITKANQEKRYLGWTDIPIIEAEIERLKGISQFGERFDYCVTSDLIRAKQTAALLCSRLERIETKAFREMHFGDWEMKTYADLKNNPHYRKWIEAPEHMKPPAGESFFEMTQRVDAGFQRLRSDALQRASKNILLVAHGGVIRYLLTKLTKEKKQFFEWIISHHTGIRLIWEIEDWKDERECISFQEVPLTASENG